MQDFIILTDTRQQKENHILKVFNKRGIIHLRTTLPSADYMAIRYNQKKGLYLDYTILIDTKKDLEEVAGNLCNTQNHERVKREIERAKELGCEQFYFLIGDNKIKTIEDIEKWSSPHTRVRGSTLLKVMNTMQERYDVKFIICQKKNVGQMIVSLFEKGEKL